MYLNILLCIKNNMFFYFIYNFYFKMLSFSLSFKMLHSQHLTHLNLYHLYTYLITNLSLKETDDHKIVLVVCIL